MVAGGEDRRGRGPFPGLRRGRPIGFSGASCCARMSLREIWPASNVHRTRPREGSSTIGASRLSSPGLRRPAHAVRLSPSETRAPPRASTVGPYPRSPRLRWKLPGPGRLPAPGSAPARASQHRVACGPLLAPTNTKSRTQRSRRVMGSEGARPRFPPHRVLRTPEILRPFRRGGNKNLEFQALASE